MAKTINKHVATIDGVTFTRDSSSGRVYTHCIVTKTLLTDERVEVENRSRARHASTMKFKLEVLSGAHKFDRAYSHRLNRVFNPDATPEQLKIKDAEDNARADAQDARELADAKQYVNQATTEDRVRADLADYDARVAKSKQISSDGKYHYHGGAEWCGRLDLAEKAVAKWMKRGEFAIAVPAIVMVHTVTSRKGK